MARKQRRQKEAQVSSGPSVLAKPTSKYTYLTSAQSWSVNKQILPNPDVVLTRRGEAITIYKQLLSDAHLCAVLDSRESATLSHEWQLMRMDAPPRLFDVIAEWFNTEMERKRDENDLSRDELTANIMDVVYYGYQPIELSWTFYRGHWLPDQITPKPPEWFVFYINEIGIPELRFLSTRSPLHGERPPDRWTLMCPRIKPTVSNPYGRGVAGRCFWPIIFKRAGIEFWTNFMERFGTPWVMGKITAGNADVTELTAFANDLRVLVQDAVIAVGMNKEVTILEGKNSANNVQGFKEYEDFWDSQVSKTILGHTLSSDSGDKASYAATKGALKVRDDIVKRDLKMMRSIYLDLVAMIYERNGYINTPMPELRAYDPDAIDQERAVRDEALTRAGVVFSKEYFLRTYNLQNTDITKVSDPKALQATGPARPENSPKPNKKATTGVGDK
jgi:phage gp29-like protein